MFKAGVILSYSEWNWRSVERGSRRARAGGLADKAETRRLDPTKRCQAWTLLYCYWLMQWSLAGEI